MKKVFLFALFLTILSSCNFIIKRIYGVRNPAYEKKNTINKRQQELFGSDIPGLTTSAKFQLQLMRNGIPDVYIFDKKGRRLSYINPEKPNCNAPAEAFLAGLDTIQAFSLNDDYTLNTFTGQLNEPGCGSSFEVKSDTVDFHIFMTWAVWIGRKIHDDKTKLWIEQLKLNPKIRYSLHLVNLDLQECWSEEEKQMIEKSMN